MRMTFKFFPALLLCFALPLVSGCTQKNEPFPPREAPGQVQETPVPVQEENAPDLDDLEEAAKAATIE